MPSVLSSAEYWRWATEYRASAGHGLYQSIVQQLMILGNCLHLFLN